MRRFLGRLVGRERKHSVNVEVKSVMCKLSKSWLWVMLFGWLWFGRVPFPCDTRPYLMVTMLNLPIVRRYPFQVRTCIDRLHVQLRFELYVFCPRLHSLTWILDRRNQTICDCSPGGDIFYWSLCVDLSPGVARIAEWNAQDHTGITFMNILSGCSWHGAPAYYHLIPAFSLFSCLSHFK